MKKLRLSNSKFKKLASRGRASAWIWFKSPWFGHQRGHQSPPTAVPSNLPNFHNTKSLKLLLYSGQSQAQSRWSMNTCWLGRGKKGKVGGLLWGPSKEGPTTLCRVRWGTMAQWALRISFLPLWQGCWHPKEPQMSLPNRGIVCLTPRQVYLAAPWSLKEAQHLDGLMLWPAREASERMGMEGTEKHRIWGENSLSPTSGSFVTLRITLKDQTPKVPNWLLGSDGIHVWQEGNSYLTSFFGDCENQRFDLLCKGISLEGHGNSSCNFCFLCRSELEGIISVLFNCGRASPTTVLGT